jgi:hypothetical protein
MKFNIGDVVYQAQAGQEQIWVMCPECLGSGRLRVILGDDSEVSIACVCCERGYEGSPGKRHSYAFMARATAHKVTGVEAQQREDGLRVRYSFGYYSSESENVFATREEALTRALQLVTEHEAEEKKRLGFKEKQYKTWSWNVSYWRGEIRRAKETIQRCEDRLAVAPKNRVECREADKHV